MAAPSDTTSEVQKVCTFMFKKNRRTQNTRKRKTSDNSDDDTVESSTVDTPVPVVIRKERKTVKNPLVQSTGGITTSKSHHSATTSNTHNNNSSSSDTEESTCTHKHKKHTIGVEYKSSRMSKSTGPNDMGATATINIDTETDRDAQAVFVRKLEVAKEVEEKNLDESVYRGLSNYQQFHKPKDTPLGNAASGMNRKGPMRAPDNIRVTTRWDYQPDLCKDYKETGFCGFGDSCKFMHDRSDYKYGWQLEREEHGNHGYEDPSEYEIADSEDALPFKCFICRNTFTHPVITKCHHYFCEKCALNHYRKTTRCFVCEQQTGGVFNPAKEIIARMGREDGSLQTTGAESDDDT